MLATRTSYDFNTFGGLSSIGRARSVNSYLESQIRFFGGASAAARFTQILLGNYAAMKYNPLNPLIEIETPKFSSHGAPHNDI